MIHRVSHVWNRKSMVCIIMSQEMIISPQIMKNSKFAWKFRLGKNGATVFQNRQGCNNSVIL